MDKTKIDFIIDLLNDRRLGQSHKEKLFSLAHKELKKLEINDELILNKLERLEKQMSSGLTTEVIQNNTPVTTETDVKLNDSQPLVPLPRYTDPRKTARFLNEFNQNLVLKSTTHEIDENLLESLLEELRLDQYSYEAHIAKIEEEFQKLSSKYYINLGLIGKIKEYLFSVYNNGWSEEKIKIGWKSTEVVEWCKAYPARCPNAGSDLNYPSCSLEEIVELTNGSLLKTFNEVLGQFKSQIEFRDDSDLKKVVQQINSHLFSELSFNINDIKEGIRFYSDVEKVTQAYKNIIRMCIDHWEKTGKDDNYKPKFILALNEQRMNNETRIIFSINHVNSTFGKTDTALVERYGNSLTGLITKQINGLCDLVIRAEFPNDSFKEVSVWPAEKKIKPLDHFTGVQFDLIFYRLS